MIGYINEPYAAEVFDCPFCGGVLKTDWSNIVIDTYPETRSFIATCPHCKATLSGHKSSDEIMYVVGARDEGGDDEDEDEDEDLGVGVLGPDSVRTLGKCLECGGEIQQRTFRLDGVWTYMGQEHEEGSCIAFLRKRIEALEQGAEARPGLSDWDRRVLYGTTDDD